MELNIHNSKTLQEQEYQVGSPAKYEQYNYDNQHPDNLKKEMVNINIESLIELWSLLTFLNFLNELFLTMYPWAIVTQVFSTLIDLTEIIAGPTWKH